MDSPELNSWKDAMLLNYHRQHVAIEWQNMSCPEPWDVYNADTVSIVKKRKQEKKQKRKVKMKLEKNVKGCKKEGIKKYIY